MIKDQESNRVELAAGLVGYTNGSRYKLRGDFLFSDIPLAGARVLEIGCGTGAWAIWAALHGAERVLGIDPEANGSTARSLGTLKGTIETLGLSRTVTATDNFLYQLTAQKERFDVAVMYNVVNHLDEDAVAVLHEDRGAFERYVSILEELRLLMNPGGWVIVADCARTNLWQQLGLRSPLADTIEWNKHQEPGVWIDVFDKADFCYFDFRWSPLYPFARLTANRAVQYLTRSHFVLRFRAGDNVSFERSVEQHAAAIG